MKFVYTTIHQSIHVYCTRTCVRVCILYNEGIQSYYYVYIGTMHAWGGASMSNQYNIQLCVYSVLDVLCYSRCWDNVLSVLMISVFSCMYKY